MAVVRTFHLMDVGTCAAPLLVLLDIDEYLYTYIRPWYVLWMSIYFMITYRRPGTCSTNDTHCVYRRAYDKDLALVLADLLQGC